jgi:hypothetical protein
MKNQAPLTKSRNPVRTLIERLRWRSDLLLAGMALSFWLGLSAAGQLPTCQEGCDELFENTFLGDNALINSAGGNSNTAIGFYALLNTATGASDTGTGAGALLSNTTGSDNTADGADALFYNTTGSRNVASGRNALFSNQVGIDNTATGYNALYANTASYNTATGYQALENNTTGSYNTAHGIDSLNANTTGSNNTANGTFALFKNVGGNANTAEGDLALHENISGINNTALGTNALYGNTTGSTNIGIGFSAGFSLTTGSNNIDIGNFGVAAESNTIRIGTAGTQTATFIAGIKGVPVTGGAPVAVSSTGQLGIKPSSARFKDEIKPMDKASEAILSLRPVTFRYKKELDSNGAPQFGLVAEEVARVSRDLVLTDDQGKPFTVRYEEVNAMLLNEFLKEHRKNERQETTIARQGQEIDQLRAALNGQATQIEKMSAQLQSSQVRTKLVDN